jgi:hypothetical protein
VAIIIETLPLDDPEPTSFLQTARSLNLDGPADWSAILMTICMAKKLSKTMAVFLDTSYAIAQ